jgi:hypothetical protein
MEDYNKELDTILNKRSLNAQLKHFETIDIKRQEYLISIDERERQMQEICRKSPVKNMTIAQFERDSSLERINAKHEME